MSVEEILEEIRAARKAIHAAEDTVQEAQLELSQRKAKRNKCRAELERLLCELENPGQRYPLFENGNGHAGEDDQVEDVRARHTDELAADVVAAEAAVKPNWSASVPVPGLSSATELLGSFHAESEREAKEIAGHRWPNRDGIKVRPLKKQSGKPAKAGKPAPSK